MSVHLERAKVLWEQSRYDLAEQEARQALAEDPDDASAHALLALILAERQDYAHAVESAEAAVHRQPDQPFAHYALGSVLLKRNCPREALAAVGEAIRLDPSEPDYFALQAAVHFAESRWQEALAAAERGLQADPEHNGCTNLRAMALVKLGRREEAGAALGEALAREPEDSLSHANEGWRRLEGRETEKAMEHFREALRLDPEDEWARQGIVEALKAKHSVYALMLRYFMWAGKLTRRGGFVFVIGAYLGYRFLLGAARNNPEWAPWLWPILIAYIAFALMSWIAAPLFNLVLRLNKFGRMALSKEQTAASNWLGACLLIAVGGATAWLATGDVRAQFVGICFGVLCMPVAGIHMCHRGWPRTVMALGTVFLLGLALAMQVILSVPWPEAELPVWVKRFGGIASLFFNGILAATLGCNVLAGIRPKL